MFENPLDPVWLLAGAALAAFGLAGSVAAVYAVRRRRPVLGAVFGVLAIVVFVVLAVAAGFMAIVLLLLDSGMDELTPPEGSAGRLGIIAGSYLSSFALPTPLPEPVLAHQRFTTDAAVPQLAMLPFLGRGGDTASQAPPAGTKARTTYAFDW